MPPVSVENGPPESVPIAVAELGARFVPLPPPALSVVTVFLAPQAPFKVDMTFVLARAAGVEPQLSACPIHTTLFSRSKVAMTR